MVFLFRPFSKNFMQASRLHFRRWSILAFMLVCVVVNATVFVLNEKNQDIVENQAWVRHTYETLDATNTLFYNLQDMHVAQRGFLLTGDRKFLGPYKSGRADMWENLKKLKDLTKDNAPRQEQLVELRSILNKQDALLQKQITQREENQTYQMKDMEISRQYMNQVRALNTVIYNDERTLLLKRSDTENRTTQNYIRTIFIVAGVSIVALLLANGLIGFLMIRRAKAEEHLRRINKEMESFTYIASHDLRSPLVNLRGFASEVMHSFNDIKPIIERKISAFDQTEQQTLTTAIEKEIPQALTFIHSSVEKMNKLTNGILELSRIGKRVLKNEWVDVKKIVTNTLAVFQHQISEKNIYVTVSSVLPHVKADPLSIEQVFGNVIDNAIKYLDPSRPGKIDIGGFKDRDHTTYWVKDNGRGIRAEDLQKVFEIYRRAGDTTHIPGEGLGMAYVRSTLRRLGGQIWCESTLGVGTTFYFTISNKWLKETLYE